MFSPLLTGHCNHFNLLTKAFSIHQPFHICLIIRQLSRLKKHELDLFFSPMILLPCFRSSSSITSPNCSMALTAWEKGETRISRHPLLMKNYFNFCTCILDKGAACQHRTSCRSIRTLSEEVFLSCLTRVPL